MQTIFEQETRALAPTRQRFQQIAIALTLSGITLTGLAASVLRENRMLKGFSLLGAFGSGITLAMMGATGARLDETWAIMEQAQNDALRHHLGLQASYHKITSQMAFEDEVLTLLEQMAELDPVRALAYAEELDEQFGMLFKFGYDPETKQPWLSPEQPAIGTTGQKNISAQAKRVDEEDKNVEYLVDVDDLDNVVIFDASGKSAAELLRQNRTEPQASVQAAPPPAVPVSQNGLPPVRNLAEEISDLDGHVGFVSKTRSGKTSVMVAIIFESLHKGHQVYIFDGKGDARLRALQHFSSLTYVQCNTPERVSGAIEIMRGIVTNPLAQRQDMGTSALSQQPVIDVFVDENNLIRSTIQQAEKEKILPSTAGLAYWDGMGYRIITQGAAAKIRYRGTAHTSRVEDWGWNSGIMDSLTWVSFARNGSYESVDDLIRHQIPPGETKKKYVAQLDKLRTYSSETPIALTLLHPQGFCQMPDYRPIENVIMQAIPQSVPVAAEPPATYAQVEIAPEIDGDELDDLINQALQNQELNFVGQQWVDSAINNGSSF